MKNSPRAYFWWFEETEFWREVPWPEDYGVASGRWGVDFDDHLAMREQAWAMKAGLA